MVVRLFHHLQNAKLLQLANHRNCTASKMSRRRKHKKMGLCTQMQRPPLSSAFLSHADWQAPAFVVQFHNQLNGNFDSRRRESGWTIVYQFCRAAQKLPITDHCPVIDHWLLRLALKKLEFVFSCLFTTISFEKSHSFNLTVVNYCSKLCFGEKNWNWFSMST